MSEQLNPDTRPTGDQVGGRKIRRINMDKHTSFIIGFNYGNHNKVELASNEISVQFPDVDAEAFAQGNIDGINGDRFRLNLAFFNLGASTVGNLMKQKA